MIPTHNNAAPPPSMKRSAASAWNFLLSLEGNGQEDKKPKTPPPLSQQELLHLNDGAKLFVAMVGLPARGKTHVASKITNFFSWLGYSARHFEVAQLRRERIGPVKSEVFFDPENELGAEARAAVRGEALDLIVSWLSEGGQVAVYDTSNATADQRKFVADRIAQTFPPQNLVRLIWVECECDDAATIERNFLESTMKSPDFEGMSRANALREFSKKMEHYQKTFVSLEKVADKQCAFIKISDMGRRVVAQNAMGFLESKLVSFLTNIHLEPRVVILCRHGQTEYNVQSRLGGDVDLNPAGRKFAASLTEYCSQLEAGWGAPLGESSKLVLWTSNDKRSVQTGESIRCGSRVAWNGLNEIDAGVCEGMTYSEFRTKMPLEYAERQKDKYHWRYPRGESYFDLTRRLEPVIFEIERQRRPVLVVASRAVLRCLLGYFEATPKEELTRVPIPLHMVFKLTSGNDGWKAERMQLEPDLKDAGAEPE